MRGFSQVRMICERMLREQEAALRAEYESALSSKLAEQYEAFVRFNLDQVRAVDYSLPIATARGRPIITWRFHVELKANSIKMTTEDIDSAAQDRNR